MTNLILKAALAAVILLLGITGSGAVAFGVTPAAHLGDAERVDSVTTGAAVRARADVQIRRIKSLIVSKQTDADADYERLEKLQKSLRGER